MAQPNMMTDPDRAALASQLSSHAFQNPYMQASRVFDDRGITGGNAYGYQGSNLRKNLLEGWNPFQANPLEQQMQQEMFREQLRQLVAQTNSMQPPRPAKFLGEGNMFGSSRRSNPFEQLMTGGPLTMSGPQSVSNAKSLQLQREQEEFERAMRDLQLKQTQQSLGAQEDQRKLAIEEARRLARELDIREEMERRSTRAEEAAESRKHAWNQVVESMVRNFLG